MKFENVGVESVAHIEAPIRVESELLEAGFAQTLTRLGHKQGLIRSLTGVVARRFFPEGQESSHAATDAGRRAMELARVQAHDIDVLISTSVSKDYIEPSIASTVHANLGLGPACLNFDISNACLAFLNAMEVAAMMIERGSARRALIVVGESSRLPVETTVQWLAQPNVGEKELRDNFATLTLGSGASAMVLSHANLCRTPHRFTGGVSLSASNQNHLCRGQRDHMVTDAPGLLKAGVELAGQTFNAAQRELGWTQTNLNHLMMHQVGSAHLRSVLSRLGLPQEEAHLSYPEYGNMGPASIPFTLSQAASSGHLKVGDRVALMGIGSGLNCSMMEIRW